jgi:hypothetical protein
MKGVNRFGTDCQQFNCYRMGWNEGDIWLDDSESLCDSIRQTSAGPEAPVLYLYTHHQVYLENERLKHTRSSPNWEGGIVTYATCKHHLRCTDRSWQGVWLAGLCPRDCADNTVLFVGVVSLEFRSNYHLGNYLRKASPRAYQAKQASSNPRGDLYQPLRPLNMNGTDVHNHRNYKEPPNHVRSVEFYKSSPGSISDRPDGRVPKWWRDVEYTQRGRHPPVFILSPCWIFSRPTLWTERRPGRAVLKLIPGLFLDSLHT